MFPKFHDISYLLPKTAIGRHSIYDSEELQAGWSLVSGEGANKLCRVKPLNVGGRLLLLEDLPDLVADVVVQQLRPHHRHEHRPHHDRHPNLAIKNIAICDNWPFKATLSC